MAVMMHNRVRDPEPSIDHPESVPPVQVCIRVRPLLGWERAENLESCAMEIRNGHPGGVILRKEDKSGQSPRDDFGLGPRSRESLARDFRFDAVFGPGTSQQDVWDQLNLFNLVGKVFEGFNAAVLAYGQTGSGKTYTMEGFEYDTLGVPSIDARKPRVCVQDTPPERLGLVPRVVRELFSRIEEHQGDAGEDTYCVKVSYLQIYKERIYDLLNPAALLASGASGRGEESAELKLRWSSALGRFYAENLFEYECHSVNEVLEHYARGAEHKAMAATAMNTASSRSHAVLQLTLTHRTALIAGGTASLQSSARQQQIPTREVVSNLVLVDLAGSERASATNTDNGTKTGVDRFKEAVNINQSLFALRRVITALSSRTQSRENLEHIPYRDSKLTSLLQHVIGGNGFMLMLACLSPADKHYEENLSTLQYASQVALIKAEPYVNLDPKDELIQTLRQQLKAAHEYILSHLQLDELPPELLHPPSSHMKETKKGTSGNSAPRHVARTFHPAGRAHTESSDAFFGETFSRGEPRTLDLVGADIGLQPDDSLRRSASLPPDTLGVGSASPRPPQFPYTTSPPPPLVTRDRRDSLGQRQRPPLMTLGGSRSEQQLPPLAPSRIGLPAIDQVRPGSAEVTTEIRIESEHVRGSSASPVPLSGDGLRRIGAQPPGSPDTTSETRTTSSLVRSSSSLRAKPRRAAPAMTREQQLLRDIANIREKQAQVAALRAKQNKLEEERSVRSRSTDSRAVDGRGPRSRVPVPLVLSVGARELRTTQAEQETEQSAPAGPDRFDWLQRRCLDMRGRFDELSPSELQEFETLLDELTALVSLG